MAPTEQDIEQLLPRMRTPGDVAISPAGDRIAYTESRLDLDVDGYVSVLRVLERTADAGWRPLADLDGRVPRFAPDGTLAFAAARPEGEGIYLWRDGAGDPRLLVEADSVREIVWHPRGERIAYTCLRAADHAPGEPLVFRDVGYRMDGRSFPPRYYDLRVVERASGESRTLASGSFDVVSPAWHPSEEKLAYGRDDVEDGRAALYTMALDGEELRLTPHPVRADTALWSRDGATIVFVGQMERHRGRCGIFRLFAIDVASREIRLLSEQLEREVTYSLTYMPGGDPRLVPSGDDVLFVANDDFDTALYRVSLQGGPCERVLGEHFEAVGELDATDTELVAIVADPKTPGELVLWRPGDGTRETITELAGDLLEDLVMPERREFEAPDGTIVHGMLLRPADADGPTPLLVNIHGGPHAAFLGAISDTELLSWQFVARGWTVLLLNPRGSTGRDDAFYRAVNAGWGEHDLHDFLAPIDALIAEGLVDGDRVGATGYSYGGFMTNALLARSDRFKAGVAGAGITDLVSQYGTAMRGIQHGEETSGMDPGVGSPLERWERFDRLSPIRLADQIEAPLLLMHGVEDQIVTVGQAEELFALLRTAGKPVELLLYPNCAHGWASWPLHNRIDSDRRTLAWMERHVLGLDDERWAAAPARRGDR
jgi:dipeptidyl aminopeptidase/acylaminoacyl peptidase